MNQAQHLIGEAATKSQAVREAVYNEQKERRQRLIARRYESGQSAFTVMTAVALMTDVEVLEELHNAPRPE